MTNRNYKVWHIFEKYPLFYQPYIPPVLNKLSKRTHSEIIAFKGVVEQGDNAIVLPSYYKRKISENVNHLLNRQFRGLNYLEMQALKTGIDIVHVQHSFLFNKILGLLKRPVNKRPKIIITLRGGDTYIKPWIQDKWQTFYRNFGNKIDAFIVMSEDQQNQLAKWHVPYNKIHVIPISFGERFKAEAKSPNKNVLKLVSVFRMCWEKNIADSLRLVKTLKKRGIVISYDIYGNGPDIGQLYYLRDKYKLEQEINIKGKVPNKQLKSKLKNYDFIVQLSHSESLGMSVIEAQTHGIPAIVSTNGGLPEVVRNGINGIILEENMENNISEILKLWRNEELYKQYSKNAIETSQQKYNLSSEVDSLLTLYDFLLTGK